MNENTSQREDITMQVHFPIFIRDMYTQPTHRKKSTVEKNEDKNEQEYVYALCVNARATSHFQYKMDYNPLYTGTSHFS